MRMNNKDIVMENDQITLETRNNTNRLDRFDKDIESVFKEMKELSAIIVKIDSRINDAKHVDERQNGDIDSLIADVKSLWDKYRTLEKDLLILDNKLISNKGKLAFAERVFWILLTAVVTLFANYSNFLE